jgi:predicted enzyme related to lactoylglutathione lyase
MYRAAIRVAERTLETRRRKMNTRPPALTMRWTGVCLDCADPQELAGFYGRLLGWKITATDGDDWINMRDPAGGVGLNFQAEKWYTPPVWPEEPGAQHKMLHFEIQVHDLDAALTHAVAAGARIAPTQPQGRDQNQLRVMIDPAGHPFCLYID